MTSRRLQAVWEACIPEVREYAGRHEYDGRVQDLSPSGVAALLARLGEGAPLPDLHDEAHLSAIEAGYRVYFGVTEEHRWNPLPHLGNLDLACYDREYAPAGERRAAKLSHLQQWPDAVAGSISSLDSVTAPVAKALLPAARGLATVATQAADEEMTSQQRSALASALPAQARLVDHLERAVEAATPFEPVGSRNLALMLGSTQGMAIELGRLELAADREEGSPARPPRRCMRSAARARRSRRAAEGAQRRPPRRRRHLRLCP